ncbi:Tol-Pal system beta propeller repeat protein TolB [Magnetococcus sp. PR-3]|uniref:Tol-Pal system beta propeller repeat protein TolB n=1 Tax=Magnetococcus sp. PR-3 TaxID=3120355 RepID=UPI002FCDF106
MNHLLRILRHMGTPLLGLTLVMLLAAPARAQMEIDVQKQGLEPMPIAVPAFASVSANGHVAPPNRFNRQITALIVADLRRSGLFNPLNPKAFLQPSDKLWKQGPNFRKWRLVGADAVVQGAITQRGSRIQVDFFLHDIYRGKLIGKGWRFTTKPSNWRHVAHRVADEIYTRLTGERAYFTSRIAFVAKRGKQSFLSMMDADGANRMDLKVKGRNDLVLTPRFSPDGERLLYISYETGEPRIYRWDLYTGKRVRRSNYPGLNSTPAWSPDGRHMALTLSKDGNAEIYVIDMRSQKLTRLTYNAAIDTSPSWSPDGRRLVFTSDRAGTPQLYIMNADGRNVQRLTRRGKSSTAPKWSPRGDKIAFVRGGGGKFRIAVIGTNGRNEVMLTDSWMDESPTWSPNGRVILFSRQQRGTARTRLYTIDITGFNELEVPLEQGISASDPSWSPVIK